MKALTLHQPWASLIAVGAKRIETRSWPTSYRGPLAIHAAATTQPWVRLWDDAHASSWGPAPIIVRTLLASGAVADEERSDLDPDESLPFGAVVATCELVDVLPIVLPAYETGGEHPPDRALIDPGPERGMRWTEPIEAGAVGVGFRLNPCEDQRPFGDYTPGRYAWLTADVVALEEPIPAKGKQGLWEWAHGCYICQPHGAPWAQEDGCSDCERSYEDYLASAAADEANL